MRVNLLDEKELKRQIRWDQIFIVLIIVFVIVSPTLHYFINYVELEGLKREKRNLQDQLEALEPQLEEYFSLQEQIEQFQLPEELEVTRYRLGSPVQEFGTILPAPVTLEQIDYSKGEMSIQGYANSIEDILTLVQNIFDSEYYSVISLQHFQRDDVIDFDLDVTLETQEEMP